MDGCPRLTAVEHDRGIAAIFEKNIMDKHVEWKETSYYLQTTYIVDIERCQLFGIFD
jgi:hypothetical protein